MDYDICDPLIRCGADKVDASIFKIEQGNGRVCRVLAYCQRDAERLARDYSENECPPEQGTSIFHCLFLKSEHGNNCMIISVCKLFLAFVIYF